MMRNHDSCHGHRIGSEKPLSPHVANKHRQPHQAEQPSTSTDLVQEGLGPVLGRGLLFVLLFLRRLVVICTTLLLYHSRRFVSYMVSTTIV